MSKIGFGQHFFVCLSMVAFIAIGTLPESAHSVTVYVAKSDGSGTWNGVCDHSTGCGSGVMQACQAASVPLQNSVNVDCDLVLIGADWPQGFTWTNAADTDTHITFDVGFSVLTPGGFPMTITAQYGNLSITHHGLDTFSLSLSAASRYVNVSGDHPWKASTLSITASNTSALVNIGGFSMVDMTIVLQSNPASPADIHALLEDLDVTVTTAVSSPYKFVTFLNEIAGYNYSVTVKNCILTSAFTDEAMISADHALNYLSLIGSEISNFRRIASYTVGLSTNVTVQRSTIFGVSTTFVNGPTSSITYFDISENSTLRTEPAVDLVQSTQIWLDICNSTISGFVLNRITYLRALNSLFEDSRILTSSETNVLQVIDTQVTCRLGWGFVEIYQSPYGKVEFIGAEFSGCDFRIMNSVTFSPLTNFTLDKLDLVPTISVIIPSFTVTQRISCTSYIQPLSSINAPSSGASEWTFHSITVTDVLLNLSTPTELNIHVTEPSSGLQGINNGDFGQCPDSVNLFWDVPLPSSSTNITLIHPVSSPLSGDVLMHVPPNYSGYFFEASHVTDSLYCIISLAPPLPIPIPQTCPLPIPIGFNCANGILISVGSIDIPSISFPPNSGTVIVNGNLTVSDTITFQGIGSSINVTGCASVQEIEIDFSGDSAQHNPNSLPKGAVTLIQQGPGCSTSLIDTRVAVKQQKSCRSIKSTTQSDGRQLSVVFTLDTKKCNDKWIILGSVLGGTLVIAVILALVFTFNESAKNCIRPFSRRAQ